MKIGQAEVYNFLKKYREQWFTVKQVTELTGLMTSSVTFSLQRLRKWNEVNVKMETKPYLYKFK